MKTKIPIHYKELGDIGIEVVPFTNLSIGPGIPHRDDHYMFILQQKGQSVWTIDFKEWELANSTFCFVAPGQVHQSLKNKHIEGWLIFVESELILLEHRLLLDSFMHHQQTKTVSPQHPLYTLSHILNKFISDKETTVDSSIIHSYVYALTGLFARSFIATQQSNINTNSHKYQLIYSFRNLIKQQFKEIKQVKDYASQLNITPLYLNEVSKEITGFIASYWIQKEILLEAQRLLFHTDLDVKEIAFVLGYDDYTYFSRFFKKNTGTTASLFRKKNHDLSNHKHQ